MPDIDTLRRFVFERYPFRGQLVHMGPSWRAMMEHHDYPGHVRDSLGEAVAATVLLSSTLKYDGQLACSCAAGRCLMLVECSGSRDSRRRAVADLATRDLAAVGNGALTVTVEGDSAATAKRASCRSPRPA
jgi:molecular chaperone Hsp33